MKKIQEMSRAEFVAAWKAAEENELVTKNIRKRYSPENGGFFYLANAGDCDGGDQVENWFATDADDNMYVAELNARI